MHLQLASITQLVEGIHRSQASRRRGAGLCRSLVRFFLGPLPSWFLNRRFLRVVHWSSRSRRARRRLTRFLSEIHSNSSWLNNRSGSRWRNSWTDCRFGRRCSCLLCSRSPGVFACLCAARFLTFFASIRCRGSWPSTSPVDVQFVERGPGNS